MTNTDMHRIARTAHLRVPWCAAADGVSTTSATGSRWGAMSGLMCELLVERPERAPVRTVRYHCYHIVLHAQGLIRGKERAMTDDTSGPGASVDLMPGT